MNKNTTLLGKIAVVTGAARGLGRAFALRLASLGADVGVVDIDLMGAARYGEELTAPSVSAEIRQLGRRSVGVQADLSNREEAGSAIRTVIEQLGRLDILVNNAGGAITPPDRSKASQSPEADTRLLFDVNFMSMQFCSQAAIPSMQEQASGVIVNIGSQSGVSIYKQGITAAYGASKAAVIHYTRYLAHELGPHGIRVNCISPGIMLTARVANLATERGMGTDDELQAIPLRRFGQVEDCVGVLEFLSTELSQYVTGQVISVCGGAVLTPT